MEGVSLSHGPDLARLFMMFLVVVSVITAGRAARLAWHLFSPLGRRRVPLEELLQGTVSADRLAVTALARPMAIDLPLEGGRDPGHVAKAIDRDAALRTLRLADARFQHLWRLAEARVIATRAPVRLTLFASAFATIYPAFDWEVTERNITAAAAAYQAGKVLANRLAVGLLVCAALWALSMFFQGLLIRRVASWRLLPRDRPRRAVARVAAPATSS